MTISASLTKRARPCPLCGSPAQKPFLPFCSKGCRDRDFLNWMGDRYALPAGPADQEDVGDAAREARKNAANRLDSDGED